MSADLKRLRDGAVDDAGSPASKKRAMSLGTPPQSDEAEEDKLEDWMKVVEVSCVWFYQNLEIGARSRLLVV